MPIFMYQPAIDDLGIQPPVDGGVRSDEYPEETVAFYYGKMGGQTFDDLAVDPNNPNAEVDGRDFLAWQRGNATDDGLLLPAVKTDDGLLLPAVQDDGLLLPAVQDDGLLLPAVQIGGVSVASGDVMETTAPLATPSRSLTPSLTLPRRTRGPTPCTKMWLYHRSISTSRTTTGFDGLSRPISAASRRRCLPRVRHW